jgi:hypothetical protein
VKSPDGTFLGKILSNSSDPEFPFKPFWQLCSANSPKSSLILTAFGDKKSEYSAFTVTLAGHRKFILR